jgi:hypothetical protein
MPILWDRHFSKKLLTVTESGFFLFRMQDEDMKFQVHEQSTGNPPRESLKRLKKLLRRGSGTTTLFILNDLN